MRGTDAENDGVPTDKSPQQSPRQSPRQSPVKPIGSAMHATQAPGARRGLVEIVRDFIAVHQQMTGLFERFRLGTLRFDDVRAIVADSESSPLFRLKERVHTLFRRDEAGASKPGELLRRGEALFDLAVGSLFHETLKFRENYYQLEVYAPRVLSLRNDGGEADELLREFEKILREASKRVEESLDETATLLGQMRRQLIALLLDAREEKSAGLVTRYLITHREEVEAVYTEGLEALLAKLHDHVLVAYLSAIRSQLESARFAEALKLIDEAGIAAMSERGPAPDQAATALLRLTPYARGMLAFLQADYRASTAQLGEWLEFSQDAPEPGHAGYALAALSRIPRLAEGADSAAVGAQAKKLAEKLARL